jgi:hypothetical protein
VAVLLAFVGTLPGIFQLAFKTQQGFSSFYGGTLLLIMVGVIPIPDSYTADAPKGWADEHRADTGNRQLFEFVESTNRQLLFEAANKKIN